MKTVLLCILDGFGIGRKYPGNAIDLAKTPILDKLFDTCPNTLIEASGILVGLPKGQMGNSEVGHMNIGAGRTISQSLQLINSAINDNSFFNNSAFLNTIKNCQANNSALHILGLVSDGGVHSHINHLFALLKLANNHNLKKVYVHAFLDGRDTQYKSASKYIKSLIIELNKYNYDLASLGGRYFAMDRDKHWERISTVLDAIILNKGLNFVDPIKYIDSEYTKKIYDEFIPYAYNAKLKVKILPKDSLIFFNFRPDRINQIATILTNSKSEFKYDNYDCSKIYATQMMKYSSNVKAKIAFKLPDIINGLGEYISKQGLKQLRIAETEKYAHVTYFFNGGKDVKYPNEKRILINSPRVATYDLKPEMSAYEITKNLINEVDNNNYSLIILNFANCDMVGHTGNLDATIKAVEVIDECVGKLINKFKNDMNASIIITADHGNAELMLDNNNSPVTTHTTNKVPLILVNNNLLLSNKYKKLGDIAHLILEILNIKIPKEML